MSNCAHIFIKIGDVGRALNPERTDSSSQNWRTSPGVEVVCVACGQVRRAFADGHVEITVDGGGKPIYDHAP